MLNFCSYYKTKDSYHKFLKNIYGNETQIKFLKWPGFVFIKLQIQKEEKTVEEITQFF